MYYRTTSSTKICISAFYMVHLLTALYVLCTASQLLKTMVRIGICYKKRVDRFCTFFASYASTTGCPNKNKVERIRRTRKPTARTLLLCGFFELLVHANSTNFCSYGGLHDFGCGLSILGVQNQNCLKVTKFKGNLKWRNANWLAYVLET